MKRSKMNSCKNCNRICEFAGKDSEDICRRWKGKGKKKI